MNLFRRSKTVNFKFEKGCSCHFSIGKIRKLGITTTDLFQTKFGNRVEEMPWQGTLKIIRLRESTPDVMVAEEIEKNQNSSLIHLLGLLENQLDGKGKFLKANGHLNTVLVRDADYYPWFAWIRWNLFEEKWLADCRAVSINGSCGSNHSFICPDSPHFP